MQLQHSRLTVIACAAAAILAGVASAAGILLRGDLATQPFTTARGETVELLTNGVYRFNGQNVAAEGVGWDIVTLLLIVPALLLILPALRRGSLRATLMACGLLAYFLYQYFEYATFLAYGPLFLLYVGITALSVTALALVVSSVDFASLPHRLANGFPRRAVVGFGIFMAVLLSGMWLPPVATTLTATTVPALNGATTLVVQAFDLGLLVPLGLLTAAAVYRRLPVGYLLAAVILVKGAALATAIVAMLVVEALVTGDLQVPPIVIFAATAAISGVIGMRVLGSVDAAPVSRHPMAARRAGAPG